MGRKYERFKAIPEQVRSVLLSEELLQRWAPLTTRNRVQVIYQVWQIRISPT